MKEEKQGKKILVIGRNSYIGSQFRLYCADRYPAWDIVMAGASDGAWEKLSLKGFDCILFTAALVHRSEKKSRYSDYRAVNCDLPVYAAEKAKEAGVGQFIFLSSMSVFGSQAKRISKDTKPAPDSFYGRSKQEAELQLMKLDGVRFHITIVRPPMVYGEGCPGNYGKLKRLARYTAVFPDTRNRRSMIEIGILCGELCRLMDENVSGIFHVQDEEYINTALLVKKMRQEIGKRTWLLSCFNWLLIPLSKRIGYLRKIFGDLWYERDGGTGSL